jgi:endonuclease/exonuclease/phosphatase (EEP) superfamily protein YafD
VGLFTSVAVYLFFPLPIVGLIALFFRRREGWLFTALGLIIFTWLWGTLFIPRGTPLAGANPHTSLGVLTYNVLGMHTSAAPVIDVISEEDADVVFLQEVNTNLAEKIETELADEYPFLDPMDGVKGMGVISRYPLQPTGERLPLNWVGVPQILEMEYLGAQVTLVNFHMYAQRFRPAAATDENFRYREAQARALAEFAGEIPGPLIAAGDANASDLNEAYRIITSAPMKDVWREAGLGLGNTFPGSDGPGSSRFHYAGWYIPMWLVRIDYIFTSSHWEAVTARLARFDGVSDHRGVVAELVIGD